MARRDGEVSPTTLSPGQSKNWVPFLLEINFLSSQRRSSHLGTSSDSRYFKLLTYRHGHFDKIFWQSHHPRWCDETKISSRRSQVTRCDELIELVQYYDHDKQTRTHRRVTKVSGMSLNSVTRPRAPNHSIIPNAL